MRGSLAKYYDKYTHDHEHNHARALRSGHAGVDIQAGPVAVDVDVHRDHAQGDQHQAQSDTAQRDTAQQTRTVRASKLIGMEVENPSGKELGSVNDLVIDINTGNVRYAALSYGGFMGLGDKLFAVPWDAFDYQYNRNDESHNLVLAINTTTLKQAPGFEEDNWPNLADPTFQRRVDKYYESASRESNGSNPAARTAAKRSRPIKDRDR